MVEFKVMANNEKRAISPFFDPIRRLFCTFEYTRIEQHLENKLDLFIV